MVTRGVPIGCGGIILIIIYLLLGGDLGQLLGFLGQSGGPAPSAQTEPAPTGAPSDELGEFAAVVLASTEDTWNNVFAGQGIDYREPTLVLFTDAVRSACGVAGAAVGPFYCPADGKLYIDLGFFDQLERRFGAPGDFAQAYVIAHEVGHHVQNQLGITERVHRSRGRVSQRDYNALSVRLELQADCLAGVWAGRNTDLLEAGDVEEGMRAAEAIGDDAIQRQTQGHTRPESWTHGSSAQRQEWLRRGLQTADPDQCDTFQGALERL